MGTLQKQTRLYYGTSPDWVCEFGIPNLHEPPSVSLFPADGWIAHHEAIISLLVLIDVPGAAIYRFLGPKDLEEYKKLRIFE